MPELSPAPRTRKPRRQMVHSTYRLGDQYWRVVCRWRQPREVQTWACTNCGHVELQVPGEPYTGIDTTHGEDGYCGSCGERWPMATRTCRSGALRNVLLERVVPEEREHSTGEVFVDTALRFSEGRWWRATGEMTVRPFRGLRRIACP